MVCIMLNIYGREMQNLLDQAYCIHEKSTKLEDFVKGKLCRQLEEQWCFRQ